MHRSRWVCKGTLRALPQMRIQVVRERLVNELALVLGEHLVEDVRVVKVY